MRHRTVRLSLAFLAAVVGLVGAGCSTVSPPDPSEGIERISYRYQLPFMCGGRCEVTNFVMTADGTLWVETSYSRQSHRDRYTTHRTIHATPAQFSSLKEQLAPYKPAAGQNLDEPNCEKGLTDQDGAIVDWWTGFETRRRVFDFGCQDDPAMNRMLRELPAKLLVMSRDR